MKRAVTAERGELRGPAGLGDEELQQQILDDVVGARRWSAELRDRAGGLVADEALERGERAAVLLEAAMTR